MYFLRGDQIMVWVVCSGLIPPYNSRGLLKCSLLEQTIFCWPCLCLLLPRAIFGDCRLSWTARRPFLWRSFIIWAYLRRPDFVDKAIIQVFEHTMSISESGQQGVYEHANEFWGEYAFLLINGSGDMGPRMLANAHGSFKGAYQTYFADSVSKWAAHWAVLICSRQPIQNKFWAAMDKIRVRI